MSRMLRGIGRLGALTAVAILAVGCKDKGVDAVSGGGATQPAAATIVLKYANFPPAKTFPCVQMERWKAEVEKQTKGKVRVTTFPGGTLLGAKNMLDGVTSGAADIGNFAMSYQPGRFPVSETVDLPLGFTSARCASLVLHDLIAKYQPREFKDVKVVALFTCPPANLMTTKPVKSLADIKGLELRAAATGADVIKQLGATPVAMPQSETPDAIQKGVVKGIVSSLEVLEDMNYAAYCPYATIANLHVVTFAVVMNQDKWNSLPQDVKNVIDELSRDQTVWTGEYVDGHVQEALKWSKEKYNLQTFSLPEAEIAGIPAMVQPMIDAHVAKLNQAGLGGAEILAEARRLKAQYEKPSAAPAATQAAK